MAFSTLLRALLLLLAGVLSPLLLTQCKTTAKTYKDVNYDPAKLNTPAGHGLERNDYPFDESGAYRKDWVKSNTTGRDRSALPSQEPATALASTESSAPESPSSASYPTYAEASASRSSGNFVGPAGGSGATTAALVESPGTPVSAETVLASTSTSAPGTPPTSQPRYHKVSSGDTLFSLASRYKTSVPEIKRVNGLTGDNIRSGQSLRIP